MYCVSMEELGVFCGVNDSSQTSSSKNIIFYFNICWREQKCTRLI